MKISFPRYALAGLAVALICAPLVQADGELADGGRGIVATVHPLATDAAIETFKNGGNAIDAAVAAALTLGIVDGPNSGIGGGCFILIGWPTAGLSPSMAGRPHPRRQHATCLCGTGRQIRN